MTSFVILSLCVLFYSAVAQQISTASCDVQCSYKEYFQEANCERRLLESIPNECSRSIYLSLRHNLITDIKPGIFRDFHYLKTLILSNNYINRINANAFNGAYQLKYIKLLHNNIHIFNRNGINGTENLRTIWLGSNHLRSIEEGTFQLALKLERIDLSSNHLTHLSPTVFQGLKNLTSLSLGENKLRDLPEDIFKDQSSLIYLGLSNNLLSYIPFDLFTNLVRMSTLDLSENSLVVIDNNILTLPNIYVLDLSNNELKHLGSALLEKWTSGAERLYLEGNPWACNCSLEPFRSGCLRVSPYCNIIDIPVCASPPDFFNQSLKNLNQTCPLQNNVSTTEAPKNESPHVYETTYGKSEHSQYSYPILVLLLGLICLLVPVIVIICRRCRRDPTIQHSYINQFPVIHIAHSTKRPCDRTPSKRPSQNTPAPPSKNISKSGDGIELERNGCRRNLGDDFGSIPVDS